MSESKPLPEQRVPPVYTQQPSVSPLMEWSGVDRARCPVCGNATGDCGDPFTVLDHMVEFKPPQPPDPRATFTVQDRVFVEEKRGSRTHRTLLYAVGDRITPDEARRVGLL